MTAITGNTYPVKDQIKALGGRWDPTRKCWNVPDDKAVEARKLVESAGYECAECGDYVYPGSPCWETGITH